MPKITRKQRNTQLANLTFNRAAIVSAMTATAVGALQSFDVLASDFAESKGERNDMLLTAISDARKAHEHSAAYDAAGYMGVITEVLGDGQRGGVKVRSAANPNGRIPGTVFDTLASVVSNKLALSSTLSGARRVAVWYADKSNSLLKEDGTFQPFNLLVEVARGKRNMAGEKLGTPKTAGDNDASGNGAIASTTPATMQATIDGWMKEGFAVQALDMFANALKKFNDVSHITAGAGVADCAAELKTATAK